MSLFRRRVRVLAVAGVLVAATSIEFQSAYAGTIPALQMDLEYDGATPFLWNPNPSGVDIGNGLFNFVGSFTDIFGYLTVEWNLIVSPSTTFGTALITGNYTVENHTDSTHDFVVGVTLPVAPAPGAQLMGGALTIALQANGDGGAIMSIPDDPGNPNGPGSPVWQAQIDGVSVQDLFQHQFELSITGAGGIATSGNFGTPIPSAPAPAVLGSIGIKTAFSLTSLDQASMTSSFQVTPAPGGLALLAIGLLTGRGRRRRK
ncbi:MAG: hypothetical protein IH830_00330 [Planctomycetes bacterium]|nr:hypothetical protein [Planctomycetota bacterium]